MKRLFGAIILVAAIAPFANAQSIMTLYGSNNGGNPGGAVYFNAVVGSAALTVTAFDTNTSGTVAFGFTVWTRSGTAQGFEGAAAGWVQVATGNGTGMGNDFASPVVMDNTFDLAANTTTGIALVMGIEVQHRYTNGTNGAGTYGGGGNQTYSNADITLDLGSATNVPFTGGVFNPRIWNGEMYYTPVPEPATMAILGLGILPLLRRRRRNKKA